MVLSWVPLQSLCKPRAETCSLCWAVQVHGDVFRAPQYFTLLSTFVGTGVQLLGMLVVTLLLALLGMLSPSSRGALITVAIVVWLLMGLVGGYYSARMYKTMGGQKWKSSATYTGMVSPFSITCMM